MFGKSPFGSSNTSAFGASSSLFGSSSNRPATGFGTQTTTQSTGLFGQKSIFGSPGQTSLFGSTQPASTASTSLFGQSKPLFGSSSTTQSTGFGGTSSLFGSTQTGQQTGGIFGSGFGTSSVIGTTVKFEPPTATDTMLRNGTNQTISTKHMCITAMKQYENKSLEELRCEDYLANRKGPQSGALAFGQTSQPSTSLFGTSATTTQSSIFGQNKPLFGSPSTFGTTTTTSSSLFGTPTTSTSIFGNKPATGGLFGTATTASPFGQTQTSSGLFGSKPATSFGTGQTSSLFGGSAFNTATTTASPFSFGSSTATTSTPFGQTQPAFSSFSGFQQPAASTASTGLFGAKTATSGFGSFGTSTAATPFGTQQTGGLFGAKPATGGLFGSNTGSLFGQTATSSAPSLFGSTAAKPTNSLFGSAATQPVFGSTQQAAAGGAVAPAAPIVLGANINQSLIENAMIEAQLATSPYGDNPLLKLLTTTAQEKADLPNPISVERQMRFLASRKETGAVTTTTPSGPLALGSIPAAGARISSTLSAKTRNSIGDFSYRSMFSPPALRSSGSRNTSLNIDGINDRSRATNNSNASRDASSFLELNNSQASKSKRASDFKRLDLSILHKSMQENRQHSSAASPPVSSPSASQTEREREVVERVHEERSSDRDIRLASDMTPVGRRNGAPSQLPSSQSLTTESVTSPTKEQMSASSQPTVLRSEEVSTSAVYSEEQNVISSPSLANGSSISTASDVASSQRASYPGGIKLTRRDYECEPSLEELAEMALQNDGICHIESGFTIRRLAFGSVFWPGPFDLHDVDLDKVVHFRQHEVIVYPDDDTKPPFGEELNRFAEVSLDRVWPRDKKTKEYITDPIRLEEMGYRAKLERASLKMGANFKDYRPETGTWVFTVPHFTKYGLIDNEDDDMLDEAQKMAALNDSKIQDAVQRAKLPEFKFTQEGDTIHAAVTVAACNGYIHQDAMQELKQVEMLADSVFFVRGLGGNYGDGSSFRGQDTFFDTAVVSDYIRPSAVSESEHKIELYDSKVVLEDLMADSMMIDTEGKEDKVCPLPAHLIDPKNTIEIFIKGGEQMVPRMTSKMATFMCGLLMNKKSGRVGWSHGRLFSMSDQRESLSVRCSQLQCTDQVPAEYINDLFQKSVQMSKVLSDEDDDDLVFQNVPQRKPEGEFLDVISCFLSSSKSNNIKHDLNVWELCDAVFRSHILATTDYTKMLSRRESIAKWLQKYLSNLERSRKPPPSGPAKILHFMMNGDLEAAAEEAIESNYPHLAFAISTFKYTGRTAYKNQIAYWKKTKEWKFISEDLLKIYLILAGEMRIEVRGKKIYVNDGLDGLRALGTFLWYFEPFDASLKDVLDAFVNDLTVRKAEHTMKSSVFYELIRLACDPSYPVEAVLEPNCTSTHPMDYHLSWHLWFVLRILGFKHLSKSAEHTLHIRYAEQLCQMDLYHLAAYVLMYIPDQLSRNNALMELGDRIANTADDEVYANLSSVAKLPDCIIARSKYMQAKLNGNEAKMCAYALQGGMLDEAHTIFCEKVAPNLIISDEYDLLGQFGELFDEVSDRIPAWGPGGQIYTDFYRMKKKVDAVENEEEMKEILELARSLEPRLIAMSINNPVERLGASVMSNYVFKLISGYEGMETENLPFSFEDAFEIAADLFPPNSSKDTVTVTETSITAANDE